MLPPTHRAVIPPPHSAPIRSQLSHAWAHVFLMVALLPSLCAQLAQTPPMGWNSWNKFKSNINDALIRQIADAMVSSGMQASGYQYINLDDHWEGTRDAAGNIHPDPTKFPDMKALADYVHSKGLKLGIYSSPGNLTCGKEIGSYRHEVQDANTFAAWGIDYLKYDWCSAGWSLTNNPPGLALPDSDMPKLYQLMGDALKASGRPIVFSLCQYGRYNVGTWGASVGGNLWRTTGDINDTWARMSSLGFDQQVGREVYAGPGHWNDPDMLEVGNGGMTDAEYRTHMSLWAILAAPLIAGNDLRVMSQATKDILLNKDVIAVDQDSFGKQGYRINKQGTNGELWAKPLAGNAWAVGLFNRGSSAMTVTIKLSDLGLNRDQVVRDLWTHTDLGAINAQYSVNVPSHGVVMLRLSASDGTVPLIPSTGPPPTPPVVLPGDGKSGPITVPNFSFEDDSHQTPDGTGTNEQFTNLDTTVGSGGSFSSGSWAISNETGSAGAYGVDIGKSTFYGQKPGYNGATKQPVPFDGIVFAFVNLNTNNQVRLDSAPPAMALQKGVYTLKVAGGVRSDKSDVTYSIGLVSAATGGIELGTFTTQTIIKNSSLLPNASDLVYTLDTSKVDPALIGQAYFIRMRFSAPGASQANWDNVRLTFTAALPPTITTQPTSQTIATGGALVLSTSATGTSAPTYQWMKNGIAISGATSATYTLPSAQAADAGNYTVAISNFGGTVTSSVAALVITSAPATTEPGRIINLSIRSNTGTEVSPLIVGVVVGGAGTTGSKPLLLRAVGPSLVTFGVASAAADPTLTVFSNSTAIANNNDWSGDAQVATITSQVGAFALGSPDSKDAALYLRNVASGGYSVHVSNAAGVTGIALAEVYDGTPANAFSPATPRLVNVSARAHVGTGNDILIAGFVVGGAAPLRVLIRAIGPSLEKYGVTDVLADPKLNLYTGSALLQSNDNWEGSSALSSAFSSVGAFALDATSKDSVLLVTLVPGSYTAQVSGGGDTTGAALIEVYEIP
jgi:alpha-galactosidase